METRLANLREDAHEILKFAGYTRRGAQLHGPSPCDRSRMKATKMATGKILKKYPDRLAVVAAFLTKLRSVKECWINKRYAISVHSVESEFIEMNRTRIDNSSIGLT